MKLLSRPLNFRLFQLNLVYPLRKITLLLDSSLLFKNNSTSRFDLLFEIIHPFCTPLLKGVGEGTVQVLNVSNICFTCHVSQKQKNKKQTTYREFLGTCIKSKKITYIYIYIVCPTSRNSPNQLFSVTEALLTYEAANPISHTNSQELTSSLKSPTTKAFLIQSKK